MSFVIVPDHVSEAIDRALDMALESMPEAKPEREQLYCKLLDYYNENGQLPEFTITKSQ